MAYRVLARLPADHRQHPPEYYLDAAMRSAKRRRSPHDEAVTLLHRAEVAASHGRSAEAAASLLGASAAFSAMDMRWHQMEANRITITR